MKLTTMICAGAFLFFAVHGEDVLDIRLPEPVKRTAHEAVSKARCLIDIDQRTEDVKRIIERLERSEKALEKRLREIRDKGRSWLDRRRGAADEAALLMQLKEVRVERQAALDSLERLRTERVRMQVRQEVLAAESDRREIEGYLQGSVPGPIDSIASGLDDEPILPVHIAGR